MHGVCELANIDAESKYISGIFIALRNLGLFLFRSAATCISKALIKNKVYFKRTDGLKLRLKVYS